MTEEATNREMVQMMRRCSAEIKELRQQIAYLQPKAEAYENLALVLRLMPDQMQRTMSEDLTWVLDKRIRELEQASTEA